MIANKIVYFFIVIFLSIGSVKLEAYILLNEYDKISTPLPQPYEGKIYSRNDLNLFIDNSLTSGKQPIIIFGANWCPDCRIFSGTMEIPRIKSFIMQHFDILYVDVKRYEINMDLMEEYGIPSQEGIPRVLVFDHEKNLLNSSTTAEWRTARERSSQDIFNFFQDLALKKQ